MLETRVVDAFPLCDQEVMLRHLHATAKKYVDDHESGRVDTPVRISAAS
jgi:hypothetical protein